MYNIIVLHLHCLASTATFWLKILLQQECFVQRRCLLVENYSLVTMPTFTSADLPLVKPPFFYFMLAHRQQLPDWLLIVMSIWSTGWWWRSHACGPRTFHLQPGWGIPHNLNWVTGHGSSLDPSVPRRPWAQQWSSRPSLTDEDQV